MAPPLLSTILDRTPPTAPGGIDLRDTQATHATQRSTSPLQVVLFPARMFLALGWIRAGVEKFIDAQWWSGDYLLDFLADHELTMLPPLLGVADWIGPQIAVLLSLLVLIAELIIGFCLVTGRNLGKALVGASVLNLAFVAFGAVNPSAFYLIIQLTLLLALYFQRPKWSAARSAGIAGAAALIALSVVPFIGTLHPAEVIDDPALMIITVMMLGAATIGIRAIDE